jgi:hypothetical protein
VRPDKHTRPEYVAAFNEIAARIAATVATAPRKVLPIGMYVAGGAALHFYTGERVSQDIDASFSHRIALPENLEVAYRDADGAARLLYFDRQYNDTFGLLHEDAHEDAEPLVLPGIDRTILDVRLLSPVDLAVSKIARFSSQDREDIAALARHRLLNVKTLRRRAEEALGGYVGDIMRVRGSIELACRIVADAEQRHSERSRK